MKAHSLHRLRVRHHLFVSLIILVPAVVFVLPNRLSSTLAVTPSISQAAPTVPPIIGSPKITFKQDVFQQTLTNAVAPNVMGYSFVLIKDGRIVSEKAGGKARNQVDGNKPMTTSTPQNIGSLTKFITGTTLLHQMDYPSKWSPGKNRNLKTQLDYPMWGLFPKVWLDTIGNQQIRAIKLRQLLQHRSGFDTDYQGSRTVLGYLAGGFDPQQFNQREYANINFVLLGYLLPLYDYPPLKFELNQQTASKSTVEADQIVRKALGDRMDKLFHDRIWDKMSFRINPSCDPEVDYGNKIFAYGYKSKNDTNKGRISSEKKRDLSCKGQGGYYMSAREYAAYVAHFSATELIVKKTTRDTMFSEGMAANDRLVWAVATGDNWMKQHFQMPTIVWSNGVVDGSRTILVRLPQNFYLILFTNSEDMSASSLYNAGISAFKAGMAHNFN